MMWNGYVSLVVPELALGRLELERVPEAGPEKSA